MKKLLVFLLLVISFQAIAQTYPITGINISLPANPDANIAEWSKAMPPLMISAQTRMEYGKVSPMVMESRILVSIKGNGAVCGSYTKANAPASNFNSPAKVWSGETALNLLGKACVLKPGNYEFCVQFYGEGAVGQVLIGEGCKSFTIKETEHLTYQPPQPLAPANGTILNDNVDLKKPMTFRWTSVIPKPQEPVTYRLKVWQLMQGQTGIQAIQVNQPIITKDVDNMTEAITYITGDFTSPQMLAFVWTVQALSREGKPIGENNGTSNPSQFSATSCDVNLALKLQSIECLPTTHGFNHYKVCITSTYSSSNTNLTYSGSNGIKAYAPSYTPFYTVSNITPALQVQNGGGTTTVPYCFEVSVPIGQTSIKIGLQGDDKDPGPMVCQPGAELDLRLPDCTVPTCECGTWSPLTVLDAAQGKRYDCGSTIEWTCKQALNFTASYQCSPNDKTCVATTTWNIKKGAIVIKSGTGTNQLNDGFSLLENGTYILTLNASCNGKVCPPCTYTITVRDCKNCDCGEWDGSSIKIQKDGAIISNVKCDGDVSLGIGTVGIQFSNFICSPSNDNCFSTYLWTVQGPVSGNGAGNIINFNFSQAGIYTVTLTPFCGGKRCNPCKIVIKIEDPLPCSLGFLDNLKDNYCVGDQVTINWTGTPNPSIVNLVLIDFTNWTVFQTIAANIPNSGTYTWTLPTNLPCDPERKWCFYVTDPAQNPQCWNYSKEFTIGCCKSCDCGNWSSLLVNRLRYDCGNEKPIKWSCNKPIEFSNSYQCSPNDKTCQAKTKWEVTKDGQNYNSGSGSSGTFTPTENGIYTLTLHANCNGKECKPCVTTFIVDDCETCDCGKWGSLVVPTLTGNKTYQCGIKMLIPWSCKQPFNFSDTYQCSPNNTSCQTNTTWEVKKGTNLINSGTGTNTLNGTFTPTENGIYTITINASCNGIKCKPCIYTIAVDDCVQPCISIVRDSIWCINEAAGRYGFNLTVQNSTGSTCSLQATIVPGNGTLTGIGGLPISIPLGVSTVSGHFNGVVGVNGQLCLQFYCVQGNDNCSIVHCFKLPTCIIDTCNCGTWSPLTVLDAAHGKKYDCGSKIAWSCKTPFQFTSSYQCSPNDKSCEATTTWDIKKGANVIKSGTGTNQLSDGFSLMENGTYILTLNASCNGKVCPPCTYTIIVSDCIDKPCDCGKWNNSGIKIQKDGAIISNLKCGGDASLGIGTYGIQFSNFICNPSNDNCLVTYSWSVQGPNSGNGTGNIINFNFSQVGTYTVTLTPFCGDKRCEPCKIVIKIEDPLPCSLSFLDNLKDNYCVGDQVTINWTGTAQPSTVNLVLIDFTNWIVYQVIATSIPNSGSYTWTLPANLPCDPERKWCFYVTDPAQSPKCWNYSKEFTIGCCIVKPCDCGKWDDSSIKIQKGGAIISNIKCDGAVSLGIGTYSIQFPNFICDPNNDTCLASYSYSVQGPASSQGGPGNTIIFNFGQVGNYTVILTPLCGGKRCNPCEIVIKIEEPCIPNSLGNNVIAFYPFSNGSLNDIAGNNQHLTNPTTASSTSDRNGNLNCAYEFDNLPTSGEFLKISNTSFLNNLNEFSISLWYQPKDTSRKAGDFESLINRDLGGSCPNRNGQWSVGLYDCRKAVFGRTNSVWDNNITNFDCQQEINVRTDNWNHLVATFKQNGLEMKIYRNGVLQASSTGNANCGGSAPPSYQDIGDLFLGKDYTGKIDDVILFNKTLSQQEVNTLFNMETCCEE